jgi:hypothetical protein
MTAPSFDSTHSIRFDLGSGNVRAAGQDERLLLLPAAALENVLLYASADAVVALGRAMGESIGRRVAARIVGHSNASMEDFTTQFAGEAALAGVGAISLERWGRALVVLVEQSPLGSALLAPLIAAALGAATGRKVGGVLLTHDDRIARVLIASSRGVERVQGWMAAGVSWGDAIVKLHGAGS